MAIVVSKLASGKVTKATWVSKLVAKKVELGYLVKDIEQNGTE